MPRVTYSSFLNWIAPTTNLVGAVDIYSMTMILEPDIFTKLKKDEETGLEEEQQIGLWLYWYFSVGQNSLGSSLLRNSRIVFSQMIRTAVTMAAAGCRNLGIPGLPSVDLLVNSIGLFVHGHSGRVQIVFHTGTSFAVSPVYIKLIYWDLLSRHLHDLWFGNSICFRSGSRDS
jgi:hypothetical protein